MLYFVQGEVLASDFIVKYFLGVQYIAHDHLIITLSLLQGSETLVDCLQKVVNVHALIYIQEENYPLRLIQLY